MPVDLARHQKRAVRLLAEHAHAARTVREERERLAAARQALDDARAAQALLQDVAEHVQRQATARIAGVVTRALKAVFGEEQSYVFDIRFEQKRGRTDARLVFLRNGQEVDPTSAAGGGVVDVAAFALRAVCLALARPRPRQLLVLDEPMKHVSSEYRPAVRDLILSLSHELRVQIVMVTHSRELMVWKVVDLGEL